MNEQIQQLKKDIAELEAYKLGIERQQLTFPLDKKSRDVIEKDLMVPTGKVTYPTTVLTVTAGVEVVVNGKRYLTHAMP
jgi:hypothetical protein